MLNESVIKVLKNGMWDLATCANGEPNVVPVAFKKFRYMCVIWQEYKATQNKINKIQSAEDLSEFRKVSEEMVESIYGNAPDEIKEIYKKNIVVITNEIKGTKRGNQ